MKNIKSPKRIADIKPRRAGPSCLSVSKKLFTDPTYSISDYSDLARTPKRAGVAVINCILQLNEENPYPRWLGFGPHEPLEQRFVDKNHLENTDILIAGCGTGSQIMLEACRNINPKITAVDLSLSSMAYAMRKTREFGIENVEFRQADILKLGKLGKKFDIIGCTGVLHHMKDPQAGLAVIAGLMKDTGKITLALYSEIGRQSIVKARKVIAEKGFESTPEGIRAFRDDLKHHDKDLYTSLAKYRDFFSLSMCRDLVFHVQETRYTLLEIRDMLDKEGLVLEQLSVNQKTLEDYRERFPDDRKAVNLENWHIYEEENPTTFAAQYHFTAIKKH
jgi:ubiquinone/menaquinone biosynthesis C-methylase UbiE